MSFFDTEKFETLRKARHVTWGRPVRVLSDTTSTNDEGLAAVSGNCKTGIVWIAQHQSEGRGRRGSAWLAPPGEGLTFSTLVRYVGPPGRLKGLSLAVGLAVRDAVSIFLQRQGLHPLLQVKWPNDIYADGKKLAGVLVETRPDGPGAFGVVVGIGLNVKTVEFPPEVRAGATSLALLDADLLEKPLESLLADVLGALEKRMSVLFARGLLPLLADLQAVDFLVDKKVAIEGRQGVARGVDAGGGLVLELADGQTIVITGGHIEVIDGG